MRKFFCPLLVLLAAWFCLLPGALAKENAPRVREADREYVLAWMDKDSKTYIKRDAVKVDKYEPPKYNVSAEVVQTDGKNRIKSTAKEYYFYAYDTRKMYCTTDGGFNYLPPDDKTAEIEKQRAIGEMIFCLANNRHFYGKDAGYKDEFYMPAWKGQKKKK